MRRSFAFRDPLGTTNARGVSRDGAFVPASLMVFEGPRHIRVVRGLQALSNDLAVSRDGALTWVTSNRTNTASVFGMPGS